MKRYIFPVVALSGLVVALGAPAVASADGVGFTPVGNVFIPFATPLYPGGPYTLELDRVTIDPGSSTPWHTHPASVYGLVTKGTVTVQFADCSKRVTDSGGSYIEDPGVVHHGYNNGPSDAALYALFVVPQGTNALSPVDGPAC